MRRGEVAAPYSVGATIGRPVPGEAFGLLGGGGEAGTNHRGMILGWAVITAVLVVGPTLAGPNPPATNWDARCQGLVDRAVDDGVTPTDCDEVLLALGWRSLLADRTITEGLLDRLTAAAKDPLMVDELRSWRARLAAEEGRTAAAREFVRAEGILDRWWAAGPLPIEELDDIDSLKPWPQNMSWRRAFGTDAEGWVDLDGLGWPTERQVLYLATTLESKSRRAVAFRFGGSEAVRLWLNGRLMGSTPHPTVHGEDQVEVGGWLGAGSNVVVVAVAVERGKWWLRVRATRPDGGQLEGVRETEQQPEAPESAEPSGEASPPIRSLQSELEAAEKRGEPGARTALAALLVQRRPEAVGTGTVKAACASAQEESPVIGRWLEWLVTDEPAEQRRLLGEILERDPAFVPARLEMAVWLYRRGLREAAHRVLEAAGGSEPALTATALDLDADVWGALTLPQLEAAAKASPHCVRLLSILASRAMDGERWDLAARASGALEQLVPDAGSSASLAQRLAGADGDVEALVEILEHRLQAQPNDLGALQRLARLENARGHMERAVDLLQRAVARCPGQPQLTMDLAGLVHAMGKDAEAERLARVVLKARPQDRRAQRFLELLGSAAEDRSWARSPEELRQMGKEAEDLDGAWVQLLDHHEVRFLPGNLTEERVQWAYQVRDPERADPLRQHTIAVVPERQRLRVLAARILRAGGEVSASQGTTPRLAEPAFNLYYDTRLRVLSFPKLEAGDIIEITYLLSETAESNETGSYRGGMILLAGPVPVLKTEVVLDAASGLLPAWELAGTEKQPRREDVSGRDRLVFNWDRTPAVPPDVPSGPPLLATPHLVYSTRPDWGQLATWYERHVAPRLRASEEVRDLAARLTAKATTRDEKIRALYHYVTDKIRYVGLEFGEHRFRPFSADWVLRHRMGDCKDKAALLVTLLREVGIEADMVLVRTANLGPVASHLAILEDFNHAIAFVPGENLWLDGTATGADPWSMPGLDRGAWALVVRGKDSQPQVTPGGGAGARTLHYAIRPGKTPAEPLQVEVGENSTGDAAQALRSGLGGSRDPQRLERWFQGWFPGAKVTSVGKTVLDPGRDPAVVSIEGTVPRSALRAGRGLRVFPGAIRLTRDLTPTETRDTPLLVTARPLLEWTLSVEGLKGTPTPEEAHLKSRWGHFDLSVESSDTGITVHGTLELEPGVVPVSEVPAFREFLTAVERTVDQRLEVP